MQDDPHESAGRTERYAKHAAAEVFLDALNRGLAHLPLPHSGQGMDPALLPLLYVVGVPRSGTTVLSQLLSRYLPVGYINNLIARFWLRPSVGIRLSRVLLDEKARSTILLESSHGNSPGVTGPHEFGYFWRHWLRLDEAPNHHLTPAALERIDSAGLKHALEIEIAASFNAPVVFKNVICGFQAEFLTRLHARSLFVHIERDPFDTCASILRSRLERYGAFTHWWSLKPSTYPFSIGRADPAAEVVKQVLDCQSEIRAQLARPGVRHVTIAYTDLCLDPRASLQRICDALVPMGTSLCVPAHDLPPLHAARDSSLPEEIASGLRECLGTGR